MVAIIPVVIKSIDLGAIRLTQDDIHSIDAVNKLTFTVSVPAKDLEAGDILRFKEVADRTLSILIEGKKPKFLGALSSGPNSYGDLYLLNIHESEKLFILRLESLTFCEIGVAEEVKKVIAEKLSTLPIYFEVRDVD